MCQGCTNFGLEVLITIEFYTIALNVLGSLLWSWLHVTILTPVILRWLLDYLKFYGLLLYLMLTVRDVSNLGTSVFA